MSSHGSAAKYRKLFPTGAQLSREEPALLDL